MNTVWFTWLLRVAGIMTAIRGGGMLIGSGQSPDPINPVALGLVTVAGVLLLIVGYANPGRNVRLHDEDRT